MSYSTRTIGIVIASFFALLLIAISVAISGPLPFHLSTANAESTHDILVQYAAKDSDNDGLPDWEEALYGTDPNNPHSVSPSLTDGEAVAQGLVKPKFATATTTAVSANDIPGISAAPSTVTDQFARQLFGQYLLTRGNTTPTPDQIASFVESNLSQLEASQSIPNAFNEGQIHVSGSGKDALLAYASTAEGVFSKNAIQTSKSEVDYFSDAVQRNDVSGLTQVKKIGASYTAIAKAYIAIPTPKETVAAHLAVANALARLGSDITDMSVFATDPLRAYVGLAAYEKDAPALATALSTLGTIYTDEQVVVPDGTTGSSFYQTLKKAAGVTQ